MYIVAASESDEGLVFWEGGRGVICLHPIFRAVVELGTALSQLVIILLVPYPSLGLTNGLKITPVNSLVS